jgi:hypothetical protein
MMTGRDGEGSHQTSVFQQPATVDGLPTVPMMTYSAWALDTFVNRIAPALAAASEDAMARKWVASCGPGCDEQTRFRLFPGSLYLLWVEALGDSPQSTHTNIAAALECLHNASLHHDDVVDDHDSRRGVTTVRADAGAAASLLAGDALVGMAFKLATSRPLPNHLRILHELAAAWLRMTQGQTLDEPAAWQSVPAPERAQYWDVITRKKLAIGNVAGRVAALSARGEDCAQTIANLQEQFSIVSQIMNDIGDVAGWDRDRPNPELASLHHEPLPTDSAAAAAIVVERLLAKLRQTAAPQSV